MKKLTAVVLALLCVAVLLVSCSKESIYQPTEVENVSISIADVSSTGATVTIKDTNKEPYVYGEWYKIEKYDDGKWIDIKTVISDYGFIEIGYLTNKDGEVEFVIDWEWLYGELPSDRYRILKQVNQEYISVEFDIAEATQ